MQRTMATPGLPKDGPGSNQYQRRPGRSKVLSSSRRVVLDAEAFLQQVDASALGDGLDTSQGSERRLLQECTSALGDPSCDPEILQYLVDNGDESDRMAVAGHANTPRSMLDRLRFDPSDRVAMIATERCA